MTLRTVTYDDSKFKIVPLEPTKSMNQAGYDAQDFWPSHECDNMNERCFSFSMPRYKAMIAAAPEYQDASLLIQFAWFIPACGMFTRSKEECDKWIAAGHKVIPLNVIPEPYQEPENPLDMPLPCDVKVGHGTIKKGCKLSTLVLRMNVLYDLAMKNQEPTKSMICQRCGADRFKEPCKQQDMNCPIVATAHTTKDE